MTDRSTASSDECCSVDKKNEGGYLAAWRCLRCVYIIMFWWYVLLKFLSFKWNF